MATFFLLLIIFFIVIPLFRGVVAVYRARRAARRFFDQFKNASPGQQATRHHEQPQPRAKKINAEDGEFVSFEELPPDVSQSETSGRQTNAVVVEQQVVDVEWEDIKGA